MRRRMAKEPPPAHSLEGPYSCMWCRCRHAQWGRFGVPRPTDVTALQGSFCTPECCAAYSRHRLGDGADARHHLICQHYQRRVPCAPSHLQMRSAERAAWLAEIRRDLSPQELEIIRMEETPLLAHYGSIIAKTVK